jgi:membrane fusion protein, multidrug efflux system
MPEPSDCRVRCPCTAFAGVLVFLTACTGATQQAAAPPTVKVAAPLFRNVRTWADFTGRIEAVQSVELRPRVGGFIDAILFTEGARVRKGQVLYQIDPRPFQDEVDRLRAELSHAQAVAEQARLEGERAGREITQNAISQSDLERADAQAKSAAADVASAHAALEAAELNLSFTRVTSPIEGRVSKTRITLGNLVTTSSVLTTIVSEDPIYASFVADEHSYLQFASGQRGRHEAAYVGLISESGFPHRGSLQFLDNAVDATSGTIAARAVLQNASGEFTPGLFARVRLASDAASPVALVPEDAIGTDLGQRYVLVIDQQSRAQYRPVELGPSIAGMRLVTTGLKPDDLVVVSGVQRVRAGDKVTAKKVPTPDAPVELAQVSTGG